MIHQVKLRVLRTDWTPSCNQNELFFKVSFHPHSSYSLGHLVMGCSPLQGYICPGSAFWGKVCAKGGFVVRALTWHLEGDCTIHLHDPVVLVTYAGRALWGFPEKF